MKPKTCLLFGYFFWIFCQYLSAAEFQIKEHLGHTWTNELVTFPLSADQEKKVSRQVGLTETGGGSVPYQLTKMEGRKHIAFQVNLSPQSTKEYSFAGKTVKSSDLWMKEDQENYELGNGVIGISIRKSLEEGEGPIEQIRLRSGKWTGGSTLQTEAKLADYSAEVLEKGPVFIKIQCKATFQDGGNWSCDFLVLNNEPTVVIEESFDAPSGGQFTVQLNGTEYQPQDVFFRGGAGGMLAKIGTEPIASNPVYILEPWLHWWGAERQGNWFALYTNTNKEELDPTKGLGKKPEKKESLADELTGKPEQKAKPAPFPDMLMVGALKPTLWKDPDWKGKAKPVSTTIAVKQVVGRV